MTDPQRSVLVVDDDPDILEVVALVLDVYGVPAMVASNGHDALAVMRASDELGLVLLDLMMPQMSGVEVLAEMKRDPHLAQLPVVVISGNYHTEQAALGMGADEYLKKPIDVDALLRAVSRYVPVAPAQEQANGRLHAGGG